MKRVVLAGGSGFLGQELAKHFLARGNEVIVLTRQPRACQSLAREILWNGETLGKWSDELEGARALINLAGRSVNCRYHARNRQLILQSRVNPTRVLGEAIGHCTNPPGVWLNASTATIYRHTFGPAWSESGAIGAMPEAKDAFSVEVACAWEKALNEAQTPVTRTVALRTAMVLGTGKNSVLPVLRRLVRLGLGGKTASGNQYVSWIHEEDFCRAVDWIIEHENLSGPVNVAAPNPITNREMMAALRNVCGMPFGLPAPSWMLEVGAFVLRTETELIIKSRRVVPVRLTESGFHFSFPQFRAALENLIADRQIKS